MDRLSSERPTGAFIVFGIRKIWRLILRRRSSSILVRMGSDTIFVKRTSPNLSSWMRLMWNQIESDLENQPTIFYPWLDP